MEILVVKITLNLTLEPFNGTAFIIRQLYGNVNVKSVEENKKITGNTDAQIK